MRAVKLKNLHKPICAGALCALLLLAFSILCPPAYASAVYEVQVGESVYATCASDGVLRVAGFGPTYDFSPDDGHFAAFSARGVKAIVIESGVSRIGNYLFYGLNGVTSAPGIPSTVKSIGKYAFANCGAFGDVLTIPASVTSIGEGAFYGTTVQAVDNQYVPKIKTDEAGVPLSPTEYTAQHVGKNAFTLAPGTPGLFTASRHNAAFIHLMKKTGFTYIPSPVTIAEKGFSAPLLDALSRQVDTGLSELNLVFVRALDLSSKGYTAFPEEEISMLPGLEKLNFADNALTDIDPAWAARFGKDAFWGNILPEEQYPGQYRLALKKDARIDFRILAMSPEELAQLVELRRGTRSREVPLDGLSLRFVPDGAQSRIELYSLSAPEQRAESVNVDFSFTLHVTYRAELPGGTLSYTHTPSIDELAIDSKTPKLSFPVPDMQSEALSALKDGIEAAGLAFMEWNTAPDMRGTSYIPGEGVTLSSKELEALYDPDKDAYLLTLYAHCVKRTNVLYVDGTREYSGSGAPADGSAEKPYGSFAEAYAHLEKYAASNSVWDNYILVLGETELTGLGTAPATITSGNSSGASASVRIGQDARAEANGSTRFIDLDFLGENAAFYANGHPVIFGSGVTMQEGFTLYGGARAQNVPNASLTVTGGRYAAVYGGGEQAGVGSAQAKGEITLFFGKDAYAQNLYGASRSAEDYADIKLTVAGVAENIYGGGLSGKTFGNTAVLLSGSAKNVYGGGKQAELEGSSSVTLDENAEVENTLFGGGEGEDDAASGAGRVTGSATVNVYGKADTLYGGGDKPSARVSGGTRINIHASGYVKSLYGGGRRAAVSGEYPLRISGMQYACITMVHGSAQNVYGGGGAPVSGGTYVNITGSAHNVYGSGTGSVQFTAVRVAGSVSGSVYGAGGNVDSHTLQGIPAVSLRLLKGAEVGGSVYGGGSQAIYGEVQLISAANIQGSVYGGGAAGDILHEDALTLAVSLQLLGGSVQGNVYGGGRYGSVLGDTRVLIHSDTVVEGSVFGSSGKGVSGYASITLRRCTVEGALKGGAAQGTGITLSGFNGTLSSIEDASVLRLYDSALAFDAADAPRYVLSGIQELSFAASGGQSGNTAVTFAQNHLIRNLGKITVLDSRGRNTIALNSGTLLLDNSANPLDGYTRVEGVLNISIGERFSPAKGAYVIGSRQSTGGFRLSDAPSALEYIDDEGCRTWHAGIGGYASITPYSQEEQHLSTSREKSATIPPNGAFAADFEAGYYPERDSAHAFVFSRALPAGTRLELIDKSAKTPRHYTLTLSRKRKTIRFADFKTPEGEAYSEPAPVEGRFTEESYRLIVDFSNVPAATAPESGTVSLHIGGKRVMPYTAAQTASPEYIIAERAVLPMLQGGAKAAPQAADKAG